MIFLKKIFKILSYVIYITSSFYILVLLPMLFSIKPMVVISSSMEPTFNIGDIIYLNKTTVSQLKDGDIITYSKKDGTQITHRVYEKKNNSLIVKGDANSFIDDIEVTDNNLKGKVMNFKIPLAGRFIMLFKEYPIIFIAIIIVIIGINYSLSISLKIQEKESRKKMNKELEKQLEKII